LPVKLINGFIKSFNYLQISVLKILYCLIFYKKNMPVCAGNKIFLQFLQQHLHIMSKKKLSATQCTQLLTLLKTRFEKNDNRHKGLNWSKLLVKLETAPEKLWSLNEMEASGGEPDVVGYDKQTGEYIFFDCSPESPAGRRSFCYDHQALDARKEHKPKNSIMDMAHAMGIELLNEEQYKYLQQLGNFDVKTSSWIVTPGPIRKLGGALFCDRRYNHVFVYHNGAESYYAARGFRGSLRV
jgi:hypothetical protein